MRERVVDARKKKEERRPSPCSRAPMGGKKPAGDVRAMPCKKHRHGTLTTKIQATSL